MELKHYLSVLQKWTWLLVLAPLLTVGVTWYGSQRMQPAYQASTTLLISQMNGPSLDYYSLLTSERVAQTYAELFTKRPILQAVIDNLGVDLTPRELATKVSVRQPANTGLLEISVEDTDPELAVALANTLVDTFLTRNEQSFDSGAAGYERTLERQIKALEGEISRLEDELAQRASITEPQLRTQSSEPAATGVSVLEASLRENRLTYATLLNSYLQIRSNEEQPLRISVVEPAAMPATKVRPRIFFNVAVAFAASLLLTLGFIFLIDHVSDRVISLSNAADVLQVPTLTAVPHIRSRTADLVPPYTATRPTSPFAEAYRTLWTNIQFSHGTVPLKSLLITSSSPKDGKTTSVANLGIVMAQAGMTVLLIDADLRTGQLHKSFGLSNDQGLTTLLTSDADIEQNDVLETDIPNLLVLPSGPLPAIPSSMLDSERLQEVISAFSANTDMILIDSPPILAVTDALIIAPHVDGVVFLVQDDRTSVEAAQRAMRQLNSTGASILGTALTHSSVRRNRYYHDQQFLEPVHTKVDALTSRTGLLSKVVRALPAQFWNNTRVTRNQTNGHLGDGTPNEQRQNQGDSVVDEI